MEQKVTKRQKEVLQIIYNNIKNSGFPPSFNDLKEGLDINSNQTILDHLANLEKKRLIKREEGSARGIKILKKGFGILGANQLVPVVGTTAAGGFAEAIEEIENWEELSEEIAKLNDDLIIVKVSGDSMINAGINDGDFVLIKRTNNFKKGDIVLVQNGEGTTLKRMMFQNGKYFLKPENPKYENIFLTNEMQIIGRMIEKNNITSDQNKQNIKIASNDKPYFKKDNISIYKDDILKINSIPNNSVDLIITSPPYNVDICYGSNNDNLIYNDYLEFTRKWIKKCFDLAKNEGRFLLNIPLDKNKGGQKSVGADITKIAKDIGWKYHSTIIWNEGNISRRTAWGSYMSASAPYVIAPVELILVLYKDSWKKTGGSKKNDITKQEFMDWTNGIWTFPGQSKKGAGGHPAPFPVELPKRCIKLFSFIDDTVLDPFLGSGSTLIAAYLHNRKGIGIDIDKNYCDIAVNRLQQEAKINQPNLLK
ncbi:MAG TPA: transcriptional repressor LexA [Candidatus Paceibacterota bacterium]|nr:transcriptional repressor LexA [Candidatus Paceibacterota bacterium]